MPEVYFSICTSLHCGNPHRHVAPWGTSSRPNARAGKPSHGVQNSNSNQALCLYCKISPAYERLNFEASSSLPAAENMFDNISALFGILFVFTIRQCTEEAIDLRFCSRRSETY